MAARVREQVPETGGKSGNLEGGEHSAVQCSAVNACRQDPEDACFESCTQLCDVGPQLSALSYVTSALCFLVQTLPHTR